MLKTTTTKIVSACVAALTVAGITLHDTKIDTFTMFALAVPIAAVTYEGAGALMLLNGDAHTHVERASVERTASKYTSLNPLLPPRRENDRRCSSQRSVPKGHHPFDNYNLPIAT